MLETPFRLPCGLWLKNRIAKASMTERLADPGGRPGLALDRLFARFARGGAGTLLTGNVVVDSTQLEGFGNAVLEDASALDDFARWAAAGTSAGAVMVMQLNHPGRQAMRVLTREPLAPSAVGLSGSRGLFAMPRALSEDEILELIQRFVRSAVLAEQAGFSGVEVHAAHGYLLSQFLSPNVNRREDRWGGSLLSRARIVIEIVAGIRKQVSASFAVGLKLNAGDFVKGGLSQDDAVATLRLFGPLGLDFLEISGGTFERPASFGVGLSPRARAREGYFLEFAARAREATTIPLCVTGGLRSRAAMEAALQSGACDLIGLARPLALQPDLPRQLLDGTCQAAVDAAPRLPPGRVAPLMELYWYREQLARVARGQEPDPRLSPIWALLRTVVRDQCSARQRKHLTPGAPSRALPSAVPEARL